MGAKSSLQPLYSRGLGPEIPDPGRSPHGQAGEEAQVSLSEFWGEESLGRARPG